MKTSNNDLESLLIMFELLDFGLIIQGEDDDDQLV